MTCRTLAIAVSMLACLAQSAGMLAAGPATAPAAPATAPTAPAARAAPQLFADDSLKFPVPPGWHVTMVAEDTHTVQLKADDGVGLMIVNTTLQSASLTQDPGTKRQIGELIVKMLREKLEAQSYPIVDAPRIVRDDDFYLRITDRYRERDRLADRLHVYRALGVHLLFVATTTFDATPEQTAAVHKAGEDLLYRIAHNKVARDPGKPTTGKPVVFRKARVRLTPAKGWVEERSDAVDGTIATYRDPRGGAVVRVRAVDLANAGAPPAVVIPRVAAEDLQAMAVASATPSPVEPLDAPAGLAAKSRQRFDQTGLTFRVETRQRVVSDAVLLSVTSVSTELKADPVSAFADAVAITAEVFPAK